MSSQPPDDVMEEYVATSTETRQCQVCSCELWAEVKGNTCGHECASALFMGSRLDAVVARLDAITTAIQNLRLVSRQ